MAIEAHSRRFHFGDRAEARDEDRDVRLAEAGWDVRYLGWHAVERRPAEVRAELERVVLRRARDLGVEPPTATSTTTTRARVVTDSRTSRAQNGEASGW